VDVILKTIGDAIGRLADDPTIGFILRIAGAYLVTVWLASALWAFVDMRRRSPNPILPYASAAAVVLASPLLFALAILVHRVVRPPATVGDRRLAELRDAALTTELDQARCPDCRTLVAGDWLICPACRRPLAHRCDQCGRTVALDWDVCAWCGSPLGHDEPLSGRQSYLQPR
jgi:RNA polymerase subunit RPABC4/transcription elongation factor Spt4